MMRVQIPRSMSRAPKWNGKLQDYLVWKRHVLEFLMDDHFEEDDRFDGRHRRRRRIAMTDRLGLALLMDDEEVLPAEAQVLTAGCTKLEEFWARLEEVYTKSDVIDANLDLLIRMKPAQDVKSLEASRILTSLQDFRSRLVDLELDHDLESSLTYCMAVRKLGPLQTQFDDWVSRHLDRPDQNGVLQHIILYLEALLPLLIMKEAPVQPVVNEEDAA